MLTAHFCFRLTCSKCLFTLVNPYRAAWILQKKKKKHWCVILLAVSRLLICWLGMSNWFGMVFRGNECGAQLTVMSHVLGDKTWRMEHGHNTRPQPHQSLKPEWELWGCHIQDAVSVLSALWMVTPGKRLKAHSLFSCLLLFLSLGIVFAINLRDTRHFMTG